MTFDDIPVRKECIIQGKRFVLYQTYNLNENTPLKKWENLVCYDLEGNLLWKIKVDIEKYWRKESDSFVGIGLREDGVLIASSFRGNVYEVDIETGETTYLEWTK